MANYDWKTHLATAEFFKHNSDVQTEVELFIDQTILDLDITIIDRVTTYGHFDNPKQRGMFIENHGRGELQFDFGIILNMSWPSDGSLFKNTVVHELHHAKEYETVCSAIGWKELQAWRRSLLAMADVVWGEFYAEYNALTRFPQNTNVYYLYVRNYSIPKAVRVAVEARGTSEEIEKIEALKECAREFEYHLAQYMGWCMATGTSIDFDLIDLPPETRGTISTIYKLLQSALNNFPNVQDTLAEIELLDKELLRLFGILGAYFNG